MSDMDKGAFTERGYTAEPGDGGTFVVFEGGGRLSDGSTFRNIRGFTNWRDLIAWLTEEHSVNSGAASLQGDEP